MEGYNIYKRKDGRFEGRISKGKDKNGKRRFRYIFGKTMEEVKKGIDKIRSVEENGACQKTVSQVYSEWHQAIRLKIKESTSSNYQMKATKHIMPMFGERFINTITSSDIYEFIKEKQNSGLSNRYIADIIVLMKSIFKYAAKAYRVFNPITGITLPKKKNPDITLLDHDEQNKLKKFITENQNKTTMGIALSMSTGIRVGELCALRWKDIDLEKRVLTVKKTIQRIQVNDSDKKTKLLITEPKSETSKRAIPIPECMVNFLKKFETTKENYILSGTEKPVEPRTMQYRFSSILKNVKLPSIHFHALRHIFATNCIDLGFDVKALSEILGHSSVEITLNRYVHSSFEQKREYMKKISL